ncbi:MAG TPA: DUF4340 domain-containing protein [bacterium]|nr:DUF4340 domain-containing protein [bacterium]
MNSKTTSLWFVLALALFAFIWGFEKYLQPAAPVVASLFPGLRVADVTAFQVSPNGAREISVVRTNGGWVLQKPLAYPAQAAAIEALATALEKLIPATRLTAAEMREHNNTDAELGFDNPQFSLGIEARGQRRQLVIGKKTAPGDQVFLRVVGVDGVFVVDAAWLALLPRSANDWRDTALVDAAGACDWIIVTNGNKTMEFRHDTTNQLWRMIRPLQARADGVRLAAAFQQLRAGSVAQFITDDPRADLSSYGLQPAELDIWLGHGTNFDAAIHVGKNLPTNSAQLYARREGWNTVVAADKDVFASWRGAVNDFRDTHLVTTTAPVTEIEVRGENHFILQQTGSNAWTVAGEKFSADSENVAAFLKLLANLRVAEFVKDVVTGPDLQGFGLTTPTREITLRGKAGDTNAVLAQLLFGASETNRIFVKRGDEDFVYALKLDEMARMPENGWEFRNRRVWSFSETNVAQVTLRQGGKTRVLTRTGDEKWSLAAGQGIINPPAIEETMHRLGELTAAGWVGRNITEPEKYGLDKGNLSITIDLKTGEKWVLDFGTEIPQGQTALAAVTLEGERWAFVFPPVLYQFVATYLTIPANTP